MGTGGARRRNAALMLTMNEQERKRQEKFLSGRVIVLKCKMGSQDPENSFQVLNDMLSVNEGISDDEKPLDFVMQGFYSLFFDEEEIDEDLQKTLKGSHPLKKSLL